DPPRDSAHKRWRSAGAPASTRFFDSNPEEEENFRIPWRRIVGKAAARATPRKHPVRQLPETPPNGIAYGFGLPPGYHERLAPIVIRRRVQGLSGSAVYRRFICVGLRRGSLVFRLDWGSVVKAQAQQL